MSARPDVLPGPRYRDAVAAAVGAALAAGLGLALADAHLAHVPDGSPAELILLTLGLYALPVLAVGCGLGLVAGAFAATFGPGALSRGLERLRRDRALDIQVTSGLLAAAAVALVAALLIAFLALGLVASVERKGVGALLLGLVAVAALPVLALLGLPVHRVTRRVAPLVPPLGPVPACLVLIAAAGVGGAALVLFVFFTRLDWRALNLGTYSLAAAFPALMLAWLVVWYGPLRGVRQRVPGRALAAAAAALALALPALTLRGQPSEAAVIALTENSAGARVLVQIGRALIDRDGDGFSPFLGGPDCDDANPAVHPDATEIPDNGIDDDCVGGDRITSGEPARQDGDAVADQAAAGQPDAPETAGHAAGAQPGIDNVVVILVDTLRADRLGVAGYQRDGRSLTPRLDELAGRSGYFTRAYAQAPNTPRSVPSIFTSRHPSQVLLEKKFVNYPQVLDESVTLFEVLQSAGLHTVGYASHFYFVPARNIHQGFDLFDNEGALDIAGSNKDTASPRIVPKVEAKLAELGASRKRFAMFVHLFEPHSTYMVHPEFPITERGVPGLIQKYDYEIAYTDIWLGRIFDALTASGLAERTMVVVLSDHGEAFGLHKVGGKPMFFHGQTLYDELLRVPLIMHVPGVPGGAHDDTVMLIDMAPTVLEALGVATPPSFVGRSLLGRMRGQPLEPRPAFGELLPAPSWNGSARTMVSGDGALKIIHRVTERRFELYRLDKDPDELKDLSRAEPDTLERLRAELTRWVETELQP